jgi:MFS superfamily sulfate permease-like transporter
MPFGGGTSQTAGNVRAGAHTPVASLVTRRPPQPSCCSCAAHRAMPQATLASVVIDVATD